MNAEMIVAIVSGLGTLAGSFAGIMASNKLTNYRIKRLEKKVEKHNQVIDRVYRLETHKAVIDEELKVANHRINDLEEYHK